MAKTEPWLQRWLDAQREQPDATRVRPTFEQLVRQLPQPIIKARGAAGLPMPKEPSTARKVAGTAAGFLPGAGAWEGGKLMKEGHPLMALAMVGTEFIPGISLGKKGVKRFAILTAENAGGAAMDATMNRQRMASLLKELKARGYEPVPVKGRYQDPTTGNVLEENSFMIPNMGEREAKLIGQRFGQNGVITQGGYHDMVAGKTYKASGVKPTTDVPYTELPNGKRFALDIDWDTPVESAVKALPVPKGGNAEVLRLAEELRSGVLGARELSPVKAVDPEKGALMARQYERLKSMPDSPEVRRAYDQLAFEVKQQLKAIEDAGYKIEYTDSDPYKNSAEMMADLKNNRTLKVLKTNDESAHPILSKEQNDQFRAVHDFFGHAQRGYQFGPKGEEGAFRSHSSMFSPEAARAMATETRGQNSYVNFGPNASKPVAERGFAPQKAALWPRELLGEYADMILPPEITPEMGIKGLVEEANQMVAKNNELLERSNRMLGINKSSAADSVVAGAAKKGIEHVIPAGQSARGGALTFSEFRMPDGNVVHVGWEKKGDDLRIHWTDSDAGPGKVGPGAMREIGRMLKKETGAITVSGERVSGANRGGYKGTENYLLDKGVRQQVRNQFQHGFLSEGDVGYAELPGDVHGREAKRIISDSAAVGAARKAPAILSKDPVSSIRSSLFDYSTLGKDVVPVPQKELPRADVPKSGPGLATYMQSVEKATDALNSPHVKKMTEAGLKAGGHKWYYQDPLARSFINEFGEEEGLRRFALYNDLMGAFSVNERVVPNVRKAGALYPHVLAGEVPENLPKLDKILPGLGNTAGDLQLDMARRVSKGQPLPAGPAYKIGTFSPNLQGNFANLTMDRHEGAFLGGLKPRGIEYVAGEDAARAWARENASMFDVPTGRDPTAPSQAARWVGSAVERQGVRSDPRPALKVFEDELLSAATLHGVTPQEALRRFMRGSLWGFGGGAPGLIKF